MAVLNKADSSPPGGAPSTPEEVVLSDAANPEPPRIGGFKPPSSQNPHLKTTSPAYGSTIEPIPNLRTQKKPSPSLAPQMLPNPQTLTEGVSPLTGHPTTSLEPPSLTQKNPAPAADAPPKQNPYNPAHVTLNPTSSSPPRPRSADTSDIDRLCSKLLVSNMAEGCSAPSSPTRPEEFQNLPHFSRLGMPLKLTSNYVKFTGKSRASTSGTFTRVENHRPAQINLEEGKIHPADSALIKAPNASKKSFLEASTSSVGANKFGQIDKSGPIPVAIFSKEECKQVSAAFKFAVVATKAIRSVIRNTILQPVKLNQTKHGENRRVVLLFTLNRACAGSTATPAQSTYTFSRHCQSAHTPAPRRSTASFRKNEGSEKMNPPLEEKRQKQLDTAWLSIFQEREE